MLVNPYALGAGVVSDPYFANVSFLSGWEVANDESPNAFTISYTACAADASSPKFGTKRLKFNSTLAYASAPNDADFQFGSGTFTIEAWAYLGVLTGDSGLLGLYNSGTNQRSWRIWRTAGNLELLLSTAGTAAITKISVAWTPTLNQYYHIAADFDGTTYRLYVDGSVLGSAGTPVALHNSTALFTVGGEVLQTRTWGGGIDETRVTKGVARYAGAFTPPTTAFPRF